MRNTLLLVVAIALIIFAARCGDDDGDVDPVVQCESYTAALCARGSECVGYDATAIDELIFCDVACEEMNDDERAMFGHDPDGLQDCVGSLPTATCDASNSDLGLVRTNECDAWSLSAEY